MPKARLLSPTLRDYQVKPVEDTRALLARGVPTVLVAPTGSGKTLMAATLIKEAVDRGERVLFVAHRRELLKQAHRALAWCGVKSGATVMSVQRALRHGPDAVDLLVIDEAHRSAAKTYRLILQKYANAKRLGLTATPERTDGLGLDGIFSEMVLAPGLRQLIDEGHLCDFRLFSAKDTDLRHLEELRRKAGDFDAGQLGAVMNTPKLVGYVVEHWGEHAMSEKRPTIVFAASRLHAISIQNAFREAGVRAVAIDGLTNRKKRDDSVVDLAEGRLDVLVSVNLFTEGWDCPPVACVVHARPTLSLTLWLQSVGRGLRKCDGKTDLLILDHAGNFDRHGFPDEERVWTLQGELERKRLEREAKKRRRDLEMAELAAELEEKKQRYYTGECLQQILLGIDGVESAPGAWAQKYGVPTIGRGTGKRYLRTRADEVIAQHKLTYSPREVADLLRPYNFGSVCEWAERWSIGHLGGYAHKRRYLRSDVDTAVRWLNDTYSHEQVRRALRVAKSNWVPSDGWLKAHGIRKVTLHGVTRYSKDTVDAAVVLLKPRRPRDWAYLDAMAHDTQTLLAA